MSYSQSWLDNSQNRRTILVVVKAYNVIAATENTFYLSTTGFVTQDGLTVFTPVIRSGPRFNESLSIDGNISISYGDLELLNHSGQYDDWLDSTKFVWVNRQIQIYFGDPSWTAASAAALSPTFELVFDGLVADIDSRNKDSVNIKFRDKMERLNTPLTEEKLGSYGTWAGGNQNQDAIKPVVFGEPHNYEPLLINPAALEYMFNNGLSEQLIEIRDNGIPIYTAGTLTGGATVNNTTGTFTLSKPLAGTCTVTSQGVKKFFNLGTGDVTDTFGNNLARTIGIITTLYGKTGYKLTASEIDLVNFTSFNTNNPYSVGLVISDRENVLNVCKNLLASVGAQLFFTRKGLLQILQLGQYTSDAVVEIDKTKMVAGSFGISYRAPVQATTKLGYARNWLVQQNLETAIPAQHKDLFESEWLTKTITDSTVASLYRQDAEPIQIDTYLIAEAEATTEATRRNNFTKVARMAYSFTGTSSLLSLKLGQQVTLKYDRFGLSSGKAGQVTSLSPDFYKGTVQVEVLV